MSKQTNALEAELKSQGWTIEKETIHDNDEGPCGGKIIGWRVAASKKGAGITIVRSASYLLTALDEVLDEIERRKRHVQRRILDA